MYSYPIHLYSLAIKPRYKELVVLVSKACLEMKKAPQGGPAIKYGHTTEPAAGKSGRIIKRPQVPPYQLTN